MVWMRRVVGLLVALLVLLVVGLGVYRAKALPPLDGAQVIQGLQAEVTIARDEHGIPTIRAANLNDLMFGLGVAHAQDRLWQLETHKRIGSGRLAEVFGEGALETDRFLRALGVKRVAQAQWAAMQGESKAALSAYTLGINTWVRKHMQARPPEFVVLGVQPEDWTEADSLAWSIMMAWDLGGNWNTEVQRMRFALKLPLARVNELVPPYPGDAVAKTLDYAALYRSLGLNAGNTQTALNRLEDAAPPSGIEGTGSNNWVVAGSHTTTGKPLLANDPHLKLSAPALWYFARLEAPGIKVAGATLPGLPSVVLGQNEHIAWGFTNTGPDVQDLYLERIKPDDTNQYQTPEGWARFTDVKEVIKVKGKPDVTLVARSTRHGPVISDAGTVDDLIGPKAAPTFALAMRWTALDLSLPNDPVAAGLAMNRASSVAAFMAASKAWVAPMQNMVVADDAGHIGYVAPGYVPVRKPDNDLMGLAPAPGWDAKYDWAGWVPLDETPREVDPARGWVATANQRIHGPDYKNYITSDWAVPYRQQRIETMLQAKPKHSLTDLAAMQADVHSLAAAKVLPWLMKAQSKHPLAEAAKKELQGFDGTMAADKAAPLIYWAWARALTQLVFADELGAAMYERTIGGRTFRDALEGVLARNDAWWCDDKSTPVAETCEQRNDLAFTRALDELQALQGPEPAQWKWGQAHQARSEHRPFSRVKALAALFESRTPVGGDTYTVNVSRVNFKADATTGEFYLDEHGPSLRALYDVGDLKNSKVMHSTGQSGVLFSPLYRSFVKPWAQVDYVPLWPQTAPTNTLVLKPQ